MSFSLCRLTSIIILLSIFLSFCNRGLPYWRGLKYLWLQAVISVFEAADFWTLVRWNGIGYPALRSMERLISSFVVKRESLRQNMVLGYIILVFVIGGLANYAGTQFQPNQRVVGMDGLLAACHGYTAATGKYVLFSILTIRVDNVTYFWLEVSRLFLSRQYGLLFSVISGGMLGHTFGVLQHDWLLESLIEQWRQTWQSLWLR
jgi:hypothetical protein